MKTKEIEMNENYQNDLLVLALATGFRGFVKDGKTWLMTIYKGQSLPFRVNFERKEDIFCGNEQAILDIIDERLGLKTNNSSLEERFATILKAFGDEQHKFWDIAKQNLKKGE